MIFQTLRIRVVSVGLGLCFGLAGGGALGAGKTKLCIQEILDAGVSQNNVAALAERAEFYAEAFHAEGRFLSLRTLGKLVSPPRQGSAREKILNDCPGQECSLGYAKMMSHEVQSQLDADLPQSALNTPEFRAQVLEGRPSKGIVILLHQKPEFHEATYKKLSEVVELRGLPRLASADETDPIDPRLRGQLTSVRYCKDSFCANGVNLAAVGEEYQVHLFGGYLTESTFRSLALSLLPVYRQKGVNRITFHIYSEAGYLPVPYADFASLQTLSSLDNISFEKTTGDLERSFGPRDANKSIRVKFVP